MGRRGRTPRPRRGPNGRPPTCLRARPHVVHRADLRRRARAGSACSTSPPPRRSSGAQTAPRHRPARCTAMHVAAPGQAAATGALGRDAALTAPRSPAAPPSPSARRTIRAQRSSYAAAKRLASEASSAHGHLRGLRPATRTSADARRRRAPCRQHVPPRAHAGNAHLRGFRPATRTSADADRRHAPPQTQTGKHAPPRTQAGNASPTTRHRPRDPREPATRGSKPTASVRAAQLRATHVERARHPRVRTVKGGHVR
ncbi:RemN protein [Conexibacter woesei DSM 14684]|uniref:RemN protein n=1 Tax=Conexibacter woesei (strain DSM 14684 / CCUG 47730 / CIP 108061 / JCM 11494 / NBRC 100937 / ID131577) TaxID=469383 RepID=D3F097_CONWI|nr:RemN protein [Conexibacter woesei DSM 14684]